MPIKRLILTIALLGNCTGLFASEYQLGIRFDVGYYPNVLHLGESDFFVFLRGTKEKLQSYPSRVKAIYGSKVQIEDLSLGSSEIHGFPINIALDYSWRFLFIRMGFSYTFATTDFKAYTLTTSAGNDAGKSNFYQDYTLNNDADPLNDVEIAKGLVPTDGKAVRFYMTTSAVQWELPILFGIYLFNNNEARFYAGAGAAYFFGRFSRLIFNDLGSGENSEADADVFSGSAVGLSIVTGGELHISKRTALYMELTYNAAAVLPLSDEVKTGSATTRSLFHQNDEKDLGGVEEAGTFTKLGVPKLGGLQFIHYKFSFGIHYYFIL